MGIVGIHPGSFRKSGKQKTYSVRNLEECTEDGRCFVVRACKMATGRDAGILNESGGPRGGR
jgi:hypothetical protein